MPRSRKPARIQLRFERGEYRWVIRDGSVYRRTPFGREEREQAEQALADYLATRLPERRGPAGAHEIGLGEVLARYAEGHGIQTADPGRIASAIRALAPYWADKPLEAVKGETCRAYAEQRRREGRSEGTIRRELACLRAAIRWCYKEGVIYWAPEVVLPKPPPPKERHLTRKEAAHLLRAARQLGPERRYLCRFILIALYTGTRKQTILRMRTTPALDAPGVDIGAGVIHRRGRREAETTKRRGMVRMGRRLAAHMSRWCRMSESGFVIEWKGRPMDPQGIRGRKRARRGEEIVRQARPVAGLRRVWAELQREAGMSDVTPHTLKHTAITWAIQKGMGKEAAAEYFSTSTATIENVYWHHSPHYQQASADIMDRR